MSRRNIHRARRRSAGAFWFSLGLIITSLIAGSATFAPHALAQNSDNGIVVGPAKLYDERALENQLVSIKSGLSTSYFNPQEVVGNEGLPQGGSLSSSQTSTGIGYKQSVSQPSGGSSGGSQSSSSSGGSFPISQDFSGNAIGLKSPLAVSSEDLLQQQVGLSFEATNLQLLLDHALSDRVLFRPDGTPVTRQLAIIGFQISVEPQQADEYAVAEADITIADTSGQGCPEVAMMLPQDKTYNVAKVTNDSNAFNLGAFVQPFGATFASNNAHSNAYVVYDVDTVALQRPNPDQKSVTFGWQFRPVLGEKAVAPGTRQVYVLLSLPVDNGTIYAPTISARTTWRKYDTKSKIVQDDTVGKTINTILPLLPIHPTKDYDTGLQPKVSNVQIFDAGAGNILVEATGSNFSDNTSVVVGGRVINQNNGELLVKGGNMLSFVTPLADLEYEDPLIVGQYGEAVPIRLDVANGGIIYKATPYADARPVNRTDPGEGITISSTQIVPVDAQNSDLKITLVSRVPDKQQNPIAPLLPSNGQLIIVVGDQTFGLNDHPVGIELRAPNSDPVASPAQAKSVVLDVIMKNTDLASAQKVSVRYAFCGDDYRADAGLQGKPFGDDVAITVIGQTAKEVDLGITGTLKSGMVARYAGQDYVAQANPDQSYLVMAASGQSSGGGAGRASHSAQGTQSTTTTHKRGPVAPYPFSAPLIGQQTYHLALLSVPVADTKNQDYLILYEPGSIPQMVSLKESMGTSAKSKMPPGNSALTSSTPSWVLLAPVAQSQSGGQPGAASSGPDSAASPAQPAISTEMGPPVLEIVSQNATSTTSGGDGKNTVQKGGGKGGTNSQGGPGKGGQSGPGKGGSGGPGKSGSGKKTAQP